MNKSLAIIASVVLASIVVAHVFAEESVAPTLIHINQVGFLPNAHKIAVIPASTSRSYSIVKAGTDHVVYEGTLRRDAGWLPAEEKVAQADFSALKKTGEFQLRVAGLPISDRFRIQDDEYIAINHAAIKSYYLNRASMQLLPQFAGKYARAAGHPDDHVLIHASAASAKRPEGTVISAPKGWYDAGDYNKYIVNSGITTYTLLAAYEQFPAYYNKQVIGIPHEKTERKVPDLLVEVMWNLQWMLAMQDPDDGGVYHKLTNKLFDSMVMPALCDKERYVVQKTTAATLDFAAVMAIASRVYAKHDDAYPGLSARMRTAAERAWQWARANPAVLYEQPTDIKTGGYGDNEVSDEFAWAATELYITTMDESYYQEFKAKQIVNMVPSWGDVRGLAWMSLATHMKDLSSIADKNLIKSRVDTLAASLANLWQESAYGVSLQNVDFVWGSNAVALNQAMMLIQGYRLTEKKDYLDAAQGLFDYVLGRNPTGYSFVTGFGTRPPMHPHHRLSEADGIVDPLPGMLVGGPTALQTDSKGCKVPYPSKLTAKSYLDDACSYTTNEIAINWNAPLVYVSGALQVLTR